MVREKRDIKPLLFQFGLALALSFAGFLYSRLRDRNKRIKPSPPPAPRSSDHGSEFNFQGERAGHKDELDAVKASSSPSNIVFVAAERYEETYMPKVSLDSMVGVSPSSKGSVDKDGFLLAEFNDLVKEFDFTAANDVFSSNKGDEKSRSNMETPKAFRSADKDEYEQEIRYLRNMVRILRERERNLEVQLLEYYGLKEQETAVMELQNRLKINNMEAKLFTLKIESLQADNRRLEAQVGDRAKVVAELEAGRAKIKLLKKKLRSEAEQNKQQILALQQRVAKLKDQEYKVAPGDPNIQLNLQRLRDLEVEAEELRKSNMRLQIENTELSRRLESTQILANSVLEDPEAEALRLEREHLRHKNEDLEKDIERLQADRCSDAEELVYLKWINACLRYELRNYQPPDGKTVARDLSKTLSPKSEDKAKQLILEYANTEGMELYYEQWSSSQASVLTDSGELDDSSVGGDVDGIFASVVMFRRSNIAARIFQRQIYTPAPGTSVHCARRFYENLVPSCTIFDVECPDQSFCKFTDDGQYLICFSRNQQDLIVYRPTWLSFSCKGEDCDAFDLPPKAKRFESFFTQLYSVSLASSNALICKDFFLYMEGNHYGIFATSTAPIHEPPAAGGAIQGIPYIEKITFHLIRLEDGLVLDEKILLNDFVNLTHNMGVFLYDDLLAIVSLHNQTIHILQIRDSGNLVNVRTIGEFCHEDDELFLNSNAQCLAFPDKSKLHRLPGNNVQNGLQHSQPNLEDSFLTGIKQRLLSFIFQGIWNEEKDHTLRVQCLKKKFYYHFRDYAELIIWRVQFLDRHHLLIKFGSVDGGVLRNADHHPAFFAVYNMETTDIIAFYQNSPEELYLLFEQFCDHFHAASRNSLSMNFVSSHSNNIHALEKLRCVKNKASSSSQFVKKMLGSSLPYSCQSQSPSPYFDQSLFRFDEKLISATNRHRQSTDHPIKFILRRQPYSLKFKVKTGPEAGNTDGRTKKISSFLFHPTLPLVLSIQQTLFLQPSVVNIHFRR